MRRPLRSLIACGLFLVPGCTSSRKYESLLMEYRALEREHGETASGLSRDNAVLYGEKIELEKQVSLLDNTIENLQARIAADVETHRAYRKRTEQRIGDLEEMVRACQQKRTRTIKALHQRHQAAVDSLIGQIDTLTAQLAASRKSHSAQVQTLKNEITRRRYEYEKELYALEKVKEELFGKLQEKEKSLQRLLAGAPVTADTADTTASTPPPPDSSPPDSSIADSVSTPDDRER